MTSPESSTDRWQVPAALGAEPMEGESAKRMVRQGLWFAAGAATLFAVIYQVLGPRELVGPNVVGALALAATALVPGAPSRPRIYTGVAVGLAMLGEQLAMVGTIGNGITVWFLVPNVAAMLAGLRLASVACLAVTIAELSVIATASELGWFGAPLAIPYENVEMALSMIGTLLLCGLLALIVLRVRLGLVAVVESGHAELEAALDEARAARAEAVAASEAKDRFFANLTHEIRTPLNGIAGTTELLRTTTLTGEQLDLAGDLGASTSALVALVDSMLDHARLRAGAASLDPGPVEVRRAVEDVRAMFAVRAATKGLAFDVSVADDVPAWVETDDVRLRQVVVNLVGNAIKFIEHGLVAIDVEAGQPSGGTVDLVVRVSDTGPGIPAAQLDAIFDPFVQVDASITRAHGGTGLGLAISRELATLLGGSLVAQSELGAGSTFTLTLPVAVIAAPEAPDLPPADPGRALCPGLRVLIAEDNTLNQAVTARMLLLLGATVDVAGDGLDAVSKAVASTFDVILMDLQMPLLDGISAAQSIRRAEVTAGSPRVPIVAMTGNAPDDYAVACAAAGMDGFLTKPVSLDALRDCLLAHAAPASGHPGGPPGSRARPPA